MMGAVKGLADASCTKPRDVGEISAEMKVTKFPAGGRGTPGFNQKFYNIIVRMREVVEKHRSSTYQGVDLPVRCLRTCRRVLRGPEDRSIVWESEEPQIVRDTVRHDTSAILIPLLDSCVRPGRISENLVEALRAFHLEDVGKKDVIR